MKSPHLKSIDYCGFQFSSPHYVSRYYDVQIRRVHSIHQNYMVLKVVIRIVIVMLKTNAHKVIKAMFDQSRRSAVSCHKCSASSIDYSHSVRSKRFESIRCVFSCIISIFMKISLWITSVFIIFLLLHKFNNSIENDQSDAWKEGTTTLRVNISMKNKTSKQISLIWICSSRIEIAVAKWKICINENWF